MDDLKNSENFVELQADFEKTFHENTQAILQDIQDIISEMYELVRNWLKGEEIYQGGDILPDPENPVCEEIPADVLVMKELQFYWQDKNWSAVRTRRRFGSVGNFLLILWGEKLSFWIFL